VKDEHVKDAAQDEAQDVVQDLSQDVAQDLAENVLGAAEDGGVKVLILPIVIFQRRNSCPAHACRPPRLPLDDT